MATRLRNAGATAPSTGTECSGAAATIAKRSGSIRRRLMSGSSAIGASAIANVPRNPSVVAARLWTIAVSPAPAL